ncbi:MBL fold metallo-hydrolase [Thermococcus stetteri]|uniref:MBL fold metallo-hydrolase n=1 Tax=Thermococcus stetteri TaxID=49900 RepID=UPI001AEA1D8E|nr:MBL fold metallo-hydrolase [Thermococcus stetteri]MBP1910927.1 glyoxylase-like metal-dependent hydrolase (beta-lactamase superfamily II) [Thermococcus stetteri]
MPEREYPCMKRVAKDLYKIKAGKYSAFSYLITADINVLIDTGLMSDYPRLEEALLELGLRPGDIDIVLNTHEHCDHVGGNLYLQDVAVIGAYKYAAVKIRYGDDEVMRCRHHGELFPGSKVHLWLNNADVIDAGSWVLKVVHTPGHTSGSMCLYEPRKRVLFSGDTLFANGTVSNIYDSGSLGEYFNSLRLLKTLKIDHLYPGHGWESKNVERDIKLTIKRVIEKFPNRKYLLRILSEEGKVYID